MSDETTPQDSAAMPPASAGSRGDAIFWLVRSKDGGELICGSRELAEREFLALQEWEKPGEIVGLVPQPVLTDAEREAVFYFAKIEGGQYLDDANRHAATLRGLLGRTK